MGNVREHLQVINAGCADKDLAYFKDKMADFKGDVHLTVQWDDRGLYALQGPEAVGVMARLAPGYACLLDNAMSLFIYSAGCVDRWRDDGGAVTSVHV